MLTSSATFEALTRLTRLARLRGDAERWLEQALAGDSLARLMEPAIQVGSETGDPIGTVLDQLVQQRDDEPVFNEWLLRLLDGEPHSRSVALRELGLTVTERAVARRRSQPDPTGEQQMEIGGLLRRLGDRRLLCGDRSGAAEAARQSVECLERVRGQHPDAPLGPLALAEEALATRLHDVGEYEEAMRIAEQAVDHFRALAREDPKEHTVDLGRSLAHLGMTTRQLGAEFWPTGLQALREAKQLLEDAESTATDRRVLKMVLGMCLQNLGNMLTNLAQFDSALEVGDEAVALYRTLAAKHPEAHGPDLAEALISRSTALSALGRDDEALATARTASSIWERLARRRPVAFEPELCHSLVITTAFLHRVGEYRDARSIANRAVETGRRLASRYPRRYRSRLAEALINRALVLRRLGEWKDSEKDSREAIAIYRRLAADLPRATWSDLGTALTNLGMDLRQEGHLEEARSLLEEAAQLYGRLAEEEPEAFRADLAMSLNNLAALHNRLGDSELALPQAEKAVMIYRSLVAGPSSAFRAPLAACLATLSGIRASLGDPRAALKVLDEAIDLRETLTAEQPRAFTSLLGATFCKQAQWLLEVDRVGEAIQSTARAIQLMISRAQDEDLSKHFVFALDVYRQATDRSDDPADDVAFEEAVQAVLRAIGAE